MGPKNLDELTRERTRHALELGVLEPIATDRVIVEDGGIDFVVHILARLERKERARASQRASGENPFLPPDSDLLVGEASDTHLCVLNRFNVIDGHLLIVTRRFVDQSELLDLEDFEALAACMAEIDGLGFYNAGTIAGASQRHKHLQLVRLPLGGRTSDTPMDPVFALVDHAVEYGTSGQLPFPHAVARRRGRPITPRDAPDLLDTYLTLLAKIGVHDRDRPYNLLLTRRWMVAVPRKTECCDGISVNALGFAGSLLVKDQRQLERVRARGPLSILAAVAG
jgi:ATP adenylyltransferase